MAFEGVVKWFDTTKGYGFIVPIGGAAAKDVFVHVSQVQKAGLARIFDGQRISFETYDDRGRIAAGSLRLLDGDEKEGNSD